MAQNSDFKHITKLDLDIDKIAQQAVDAAQDILIESKQDTLVSGENIKTINGTSVLGEGDIAVGEKVYTVYVSSSMKHYKDSEYTQALTLPEEVNLLNTYDKLRYVCQGYNNYDFYSIPKAYNYDLLNHRIFVYIFTVNKTYNTGNEAEIIDTMLVTSINNTDPANGRPRGISGSPDPGLFQLKTNIVNHANITDTEAHKDDKLYPSIWAMKEYTGYTSQLQTTAKTNLVAAINELAAHGGGTAVEYVDFYNNTMYKYDPETQQRGDLYTEAERTQLLNDLVSNKKCLAYYQNGGVSTDGPDGLYLLRTSLVTYGAGEVDYLFASCTAIDHYTHTIYIKSVSITGCCFTVDVKTTKLETSLN